MRYGRYDFFCTLTTHAELPPYKGSTFRGVFGRALKKIVCALKREECASCILAQRCLYALVFETPVALSPPEGSRMAVPPHPFVIEPPLSVQTLFKEGDDLEFSIILFGQVNNDLPYIVYAIEQMGKDGIGKKIDGRRGKFLLKEVRCQDQVVYSGEDKKMYTPRPLSIDLSSKRGDRDGPVRLELTLATPLRLKYGNRLKADLPFHVLVRAMLRRVSALMNCYGEGEPDLDYKGMIRRAEGVRTVESTIHWFDWKRYSMRQDRSMLMGGITGKIVYHGKMEEYLPLLDFCTVAHLGKQTAFGLGKIEVNQVI